MKIAEIQLSYEPKMKAAKWPKIINSRKAYKLFLPKFEKDISFREHSMMILLNRRNKAKGIVELSVGGVGGTVMDPIIIFGAASRALASGIILCHNHPSGSLKASDADVKTTKKLVQAGVIMDIPVLDHLIISEMGYFSMADEGLM